MGKTSLLHRTRRRLADKGVKVALIDVAGYLGTPEDADEWYRACWG
jgi:molybdopterin-guanine dinucleotide biosynthesis protein